MVVSTVPLSHWEAFSQQFSRQHRGWLVTVETVDTRLLGIDPDQAEAQGHVLARDGVLREVVMEKEGGMQRFRIAVEEEPNQLVHRTGHLFTVQTETTESGAHQGLRIDDAEGTTTLVRFRTPAAPEVLDGIGKAEWWM